MKSTKNKIKILLCAFATLMTTQIFAQPAATTAASAESNTTGIPVNTMLCYIAIMLLGIIIVLAGTVNSAIDLYKSKKIENNDTGNAVKNIVLLIGFLLLSNVMF